MAKAERFHSWVELSRKHKSVGATAMIGVGAMGSAAELVAVQKDPLLFLIFVGMFITGAFMGVSVGKDADDAIKKLNNNPNIVK